MIFHTNKKIKEHARINSFTVHLLLFSLINFGHIPYYLCIFYFALFQYFHDILLKKYTPNLEMAVWSGDLPSLLMAIFFLIYFMVQ